MLTLLFRKMRNTKWMVICLLVGFIMASAMMSTVPIYMNASLQRMLTKDMEAFQLQNDVYPGIYATSQQFTFGLSANRQRDRIEKTSAKIYERFKELNSPMSSSKEVAFDDYLYVSSIDISASNSASRLKLGYMTGIEDHIKITDGKMFSAGQKDGVYEVIATERALKTSELTLGSTYEIKNVFGESDASINIKIVGIFEMANANDAYWSDGIDTYLNHFFMDRNTLLNDVLNSGAVSITNVTYRYIIDYPNMSMQNIDGVYETINAQLKAYKADGLKLEVPAMEIFKNYAERSSQLKLILWLLQIPVMLMLVFYLFMVSQLNVEQEKNEIAVFKSRGASSRQILYMYGLESIILGVASALTGPFVGLLLCKILGVSNGFLEFVNRPALPAKLTLDAFIYSLAAVVVFFVTTMAPIIPATKTSIVERKRKTKKKKASFWQKTGLDFILILGSVGWLIYYNYQQNQLIEQGLTDTTATVNPLMFVASTAFMLGCGLLFIRIYPAILRLIYKIGAKAWSPAAYISLNNVSRSSSGRENFLILFLILTVSLGLYSANTARALNRSSEERIRYDIGADVVMAEEWRSSGSVTVDENGEETSSATYEEPVFERFEQLAGVETATKVFKRSNITISSSIASLKRNKVEFMTVIPSEFSEVVWSDDSILPVHINNYLNALATVQDGVILSSSFKDMGVSLGDVVSVSWGDNAEFSATVLAFVDYWPSINPYQQKENGDYIDFAIMNFNYVQVMSNIEPYQVWISLKEDATVAALYSDIEEQKMNPSILRVASQEIVADKNDPMLQGMNGALTLGFIIIMIMCIIGFLIYWILSIKSRTLQFGILRAMGMSFREIIAMLLYEQLMTSGAAIFMAVIIGSASSDLFVPLFQSLYSALERVPPFKVVPLRADYIKVYIIIALMLIAGFAVLGRLISKIKINQALKLGED